MIVAMESDSVLSRLPGDLCCLKTEDFFII